MKKKFLILTLIICMIVLNGLNVYALNYSDEEPNDSLEDSQIINLRREEREVKIIGWGKDLFFDSDCYVIIPYYAGTYEISFKAKDNNGASIEVYNKYKSTIGYGENKYYHRINLERGEPFYLNVFIPANIYLNFYDIEIHAIY